MNRNEPVVFLGRTNLVGYIPVSGQLISSASQMLSFAGERA